MNQNKIFEENQHYMPRSVIMSDQQNNIQKYNVNDISNLMRQSEMNRRESQQIDNQQDNLQYQETLNNDQDQNYQMIQQYPLSNSVIVDQQQSSLRKSSLKQGYTQSMRKSVNFDTNENRNNSIYYQQEQQLQQQIEPHDLNRIQCQYHQGQYITNYCKNYQSPLCPICVIETTKNLQQQGIQIDLKSIDQVWTQSKNKVIKDIIKIEEQQRDLNDCRQKTQQFNEGVEIHLNQLHEYLQNQITEMIEQIRNKFQKQHEKQNVQFSQTFNGMNSQLNDQLEKQNNYLLQLQQERTCFKVISKIQSQKQKEFNNQISQFKADLKEIQSYFYKFEINQVLLKNKLQDLKKHLLIKKYDKKYSYRTNQEYSDNQITYLSNSNYSQLQHDYFDYQY